MALKLDVNFSYPYSEDYYYETELQKIDLDKEREHDLMTDNGFVIGPPHGIKKDLKDPNSIFSSKFGQTLKDLNPFADRYRCDCGHLRSRINNGLECPVCGTKVKYVDDDFGYFGWIVLKNPHYVIHPNLFKSLEAFIKKDTFHNIIAPVEEEDADGHPIERTDFPSDQPFYGIGIVEFKNRFDEIMAYYSRSFANKKKKEYYEDIMKNKDKIFTQSIPVYTILLRPIDNNQNQKSLYYETTNGIFNMMAKLADKLNRYDDLKMNQRTKKNNEMLYDLQMKYMELYTNIENILQKKKGTVRYLLGGRFNFSSRCVIVPDPTLRIDQITLPYKCLVELLQQRIVNIIQRTYNKSYSDAYDIWYRANIKEDPIVKEIILSIIKESSGGKGIPMLINRNPTIAYGGVLQMFCISITDTYTMGVPLQILPLLAADFDGDVLNILMIINDEFYQRAFQIFNPRNVMYISRNDGKFNNQVNHQRDVIINSNTMMRLGRFIYSKEEVKRIKDIQNQYM